LMQFLPENYEKTCFETKAMERSRVIKSPKDLMFFCLLYLSQKYSLVELSLVAKLKGFKLSNVAFMKKLSKCCEWYKQIIKDMLPLVIFKYNKPKNLEKYKLVAVDASDVTQKGKDKKIFRLHYMINICNLSTEKYKITTQKIGESLSNFSINSDYLVIADRCYGNKVGINHCLNSRGNFIIRLRNKAFNLYDVDNKKILLLEKLKSCEENSPVDFIGYFYNKNGLKTKVRICGIKKPADKILESEKKLAKKERREGKTYSEETKLLNNYIVVATSLGEDVSAVDILCTYRLRWQIEIYFKRLKSILDLGDVPNKKEENIISWLNGKMVVSLLLERFYAKVNFPPSE